ncbi:MAG: DUF1573 domain-containing protein [Armatimonadetes bacterium]|nr:DUF1573 domain-containing protein [Armatimonadota bacterium]
MTNKAASDLWLLALIVLSCSLVFASGQVVAGESSSEGTYARIQFSEKVYDFGTMYQNEEVTHAFAFQNIGTGLLKIEKVKSSCGCTAALPKKRELAPGEETTLNVTFKSGNMRDRVTKHIYIDTNDAVEPRATLNITATIRVEVEVSPSGVYVGSLEVGEKAERSIEIIPVSARSFRVLETSSNHAAVKVRKIVPPVKEGEPYKLMIELGPISEPGRVNAKVLVRTDLAHTPEISIPVYAKIGESG